MTASAKEVIAAALEPIAFEEWHPIGECTDCDRDRERCVSAVLAALDAAGYVVAPREPTKAMIDGINAGDFPAASIRRARSIYRAMIAAQESES